MVDQPFVLNTNTMPWEFIPIPFLNSELPVKTCLQDPDTGMMIWKLRYPAGFRTVEHWHHCAHGMYVLEGHLVTSQGEFGPGNSRQCLTRRSENADMNACSRAQP